jgi:hypothetical protein
MEKVLASGKVKVRNVLSAPSGDLTHNSPKNIGVSNFSVKTCADGFFIVIFEKLNFEYNNTDWSLFLKPRKSSQL